MPSGEVLAYPYTPVTNVIDDYFGLEVADPYRWLEDDYGPLTLAWIKAQNDLTSAFLGLIPERPTIRRRLTELWNFERYGVPFQRGGRYFFSKNDGLQNQNVLYTQASLTAEPRVLLDPNELSADGTIALSGVAVSPKARHLAYGLSTAGSDWQEWRVRDIASGADLPDVVKWVKFSSASWTIDGKGFFYSRFDEPTDRTAFTGINYFHKLYYHRLGTDQSEDELIYQRPDKKEWGFYGQVTDDGRFLIISVSVGTDTRNGVFYKDLTVPGSPVVALLDGFEAAYDFVGNVEGRFYFRTDREAPMGKLMAIDVGAPQVENWQTILAEDEDRLLGANLVNHQIIASYLQDAHSRVQISDLAGEQQHDLSLPGLGSVSGFRGDLADTETFFQFSSFTTPATIYRYDLVSGQTELLYQPKLAFDPTQFETHQVFCRSADGTRVPLFISHRKGIVLDGNNPTFLYGYGGFDISLTPRFSAANLAWMEMGGIFVSANLRGGGEYGQAWHEAGMKEKKQNVFDDFIAAAQWLQANDYTSASRLAIGGGSNGGLLVGACLVQRPGLFGAALPAVGVLDMLRFHKFTIGWAWTSEYGSSEKRDEFLTLYGYSPLHNIEPGVAYPPTLITTADHDDRVVPAHSFKFASALQEAQAGGAPILIRIETRAGHGAGKPMSKRIEEAADQWAFLVAVLGMNLTD